MFHWLPRLCMESRCHGGQNHALYVRCQHTKVLALKPPIGRQVSAVHRVLHRVVAKARSERLWSERPGDLNIRRTAELPKLLNQRPAFTGHLKEEHWRLAHVADHGRILGEHSLVHIKEVRRAFLVEVEQLQHVDLEPLRKDSFENTDEGPVGDSMGLDDAGRAILWSVGRQGPRQGLELGNCFSVTAHPNVVHVAVTQSFKPCRCLGGVDDLHQHAVAGGDPEGRSASLVDTDRACQRERCLIQATQVSQDRARCRHRPGHDEDYMARRGCFKEVRGALIRKRRDVELAAKDRNRASNVEVRPLH
mmetsp:Transcript_17364/g.50698  ORF Transcript_17364/g.50698 Transcript_17364/m.50698 type:complete len:306 (-) Transcript_17364:265-1182(-)